MSEGFTSEGPRPGARVRLTDLYRDSAGGWGCVHIRQSIMKSSAQPNVTNATIYTIMHCGVAAWMGRQMVTRREEMKRLSLSLYSFLSLPEESELSSGYRRTGLYLPVFVLFQHTNIIISVDTRQTCEL